jgi:hypothetical protein
MSDLQDVRGAKVDEGHFHQATECRLDPLIDPKATSELEAESRMM